MTGNTPIKTKIKFSSYIRKFRRERLQNHMWLKGFSNMTKYLPISSHIMKPFLIYMTLQPRLNFLIYKENLLFFYQCIICLNFRSRKEVQYANRCWVYIVTTSKCVTLNYWRTTKIWVLSYFFHFGLLVHKSAQFMPSKGWKSLEYVKA
jgi:hypothetical protein